MSGGDALEELYRKYWKILVADAVKRLRSESLAEDCAQETFLVLFEKIKDGYVFESEAQLISFLFKTNSNNADHIRRFLARSTKATDAFIHGIDIKSQAYFEDYLIIKEEIDELDSALKNIPLHHALATIYHYGYDLTYPEIAGILGNTGDSVRKFGNRGIKELKKEMTKDEGE